MSMLGVCYRNMGSYTGTNAVTWLVRSDSGWRNVTMCDSCDDVFDNGDDLKKTVTIDTDRHA